MSTRRRRRRGSESAASRIAPERTRACAEVDRRQHPALRARAPRSCGERSGRRALPVLKPSSARSSSREHALGVDARSGAGCAAGRRRRPRAASPASARSRPRSGCATGTARAAPSSARRAVSSSSADQGAQVETHAASAADQAPPSKRAKTASSRGPSSARFAREPRRPAEPAARVRAAAEPEHRHLVGREHELHVEVELAARREAHQVDERRRCPGDRAGALRSRPASSGPSRTRKRDSAPARRSSPTTQIHAEPRVGAAEPVLVLGLDAVPRRAELLDLGRHAEARSRAAPRAPPPGTGRIASSPARA